LYLHNNSGWTKLSGKGLSAWLDRLAPYLDGTRTLAELTSSLADDKQRFVEQLLQHLLQRGFVKDCADDLPHSLTAEEQAIYAPEIAFIDSFQSSAAQRFERFRRTHTLVIGAGETAEALTLALLRLGVRDLSLMLCGPEPAEESRWFQEQLRQTLLRDPLQSLQRAPAPDREDPQALASALAPYGAVLYAADAPDIALVRRLSQHCLAQRQMLLPALVVAGSAWIGPLVDDPTAGCWECAWRRLQDNLADPALAAEHALSRSAAGERDPLLAGSTAAVIAGQQSFVLFRQISEAAHSEMRGQLLWLDLETLDSKVRRFLPHPHCTACPQPAPPSRDDLLARVQRLQSGPTLDQEQISQQIVACFDERLGLFSDLDERSLVQLPLNVSRIAVTHAGRRPTPPDAIYGVGTSFGAARQHAMWQACRSYAAKTLVALEHTDAAPAGRARRWAYDLHRDTALLLPAGHDFGVAAYGQSWAEAVCRALFEHCQRLTLSEAVEARQPFPRLAIDAAALPPEDRAYLHMLSAWRVPLAVYDLTGLLQIPTLALCAEHSTLAYVTHSDPGEALRAGLELAVRHYQSAQAAQPEYAPPHAAPLPDGLRGDLQAPARPPAPPTWELRLDQICGRLQAQGWRACALPLDQDRALHQILPYLVAVVLLPDTEGEQSHAQL